MNESSHQCTGPVGPSVAERVRTVLARGAGGTLEAGMLRRPLRSARVRDDGVIALLVDVVGMTRGTGVAVSTGASATVEILDTVCTGRCRARAPRPSFALDGRGGGRTGGCGDGRGGGYDDDCAAARGVVLISGIVTASSAARRRRLVAADGGELDAGAEAASLRRSDLQPLEVTYLGADGAHVVQRGELAAAQVDPIGVDEQAWLRRLAPEPGLAARLALRAGHQIAGTDPRIAGIDRFGVDLAVGPAGPAREVVRLEFAQVCADPEDVRRELAALSA